MASVNKMIIQDDAGNSYYPQTSMDSVLNANGKPISSDYVRNPGYAVDTGTANTYVVTLAPAPTSLTEGMCIVVKIKTTSTGASTLNVNGLGAKTILDSLGNALAAGKLKAGLPYTFRYNGTNFILQGEGGDYGTAIQADVLNTKTFGTEQGVKTGTMPNKGAITITPSGSAQTIPLGYHNGSGKVNAVTVPVANVLSGTTIAGQAGTMPNKGAVTITPGTADKAIEKGYHNGSGKVKGDADLKAGNIKKGVSIFDIVGTLDIASLGGKQWASGTFDGTLDDTSHNIQLSFTPSLVMIGFKAGSYNRAAYTINGNMLSNLASDLASVWMSGTSQYDLYPRSEMINIITNSISITLGGSGGTTAVSWIAFE